MPLFLLSTITATICSSGVCRSKYFKGKKIFGDWDVRVEQVS